MRPPAKSLALSAEAVVEAGNGKSSALQSAIDAAHEANTGGFRFSQRPVAIVFGPENGAVSEKLVFEAAREAHAKNFTHLYVIGFAIQANARGLIETCEAAVGIPATYVQATPDLMMGDLLKTTRASEIFSVCGMPEMRLKKLEPEKAGEPLRYQAELLGLDVFDPSTMELDHRKGGDVPAWMLDTDYNGLVFHGITSVFPAHIGLGPHQEGAEGHARRKRVGSSGRHGQRAVRGGRASTDRSQGHRRPRQRVARRQESQRCGRRLGPADGREFRSRNPDPQRTL